MARTVNEIYQDLLTEKDNNPVLSAALTSVSTTALFNLFLFVFATATHTLEVLWDLVNPVLVSDAQKLQVGTAEWYVDKAKEYRIGDQLIVDPITRQVEYPDTATGDQIIARAAISGVGAQQVLKVAKENNSIAEPLTALELNAFSSYIDRLQVAGVKIEVVSIDADLLKLIGDVYYDGTFDQVVVQANVETAINTFLSSDLPFDARLLKNKLIDVVQAVEGVLDFDIDSLEGKNINSQYAEIDRVYLPLSGYFKIDDSFPLATSLNYIAE